MDQDNTGDIKERLEDIESTLTYITQKMGVEHALHIKCTMCEKSKAETICETCSQPCCLLCIRSELVVYMSGISNHTVYSPFIIKRCAPCYNNDKLPKSRFMTPKIK
jgi:hypothetical protein